MSESAPPEYWLTFSGSINGAAVDRFFERFGCSQIHAAIPTVHLLLQSTGGMIGDGIALYNFLRNLPIHLVTYNCGSVESIAVIVYLAGTKRCASKTATFMIHKTAFDIGPQHLSDGLRLMAAQADMHDRNVESILRPAITLSDDDWGIHKHNNLFIDAATALKSKLITDIADFKPPHGIPLVNV